MIRNFLNYSCIIIAFVIVFIFEHRRILYGVIFYPHNLLDLNNTMLINLNSRLWAVKSNIPVHSSPTTHEMFAIKVAQLLVICFIFCAAIEWTAASGVSVIYTVKNPPKCQPPSSILIDGKCHPVHSNLRGTNSGRAHRKYWFSGVFAIIPNKSFVFWNNQCFFPNKNFCMEIKHVLE